MPLDNSIFRVPPTTPDYRLTVNSEGLDRSGKTKFGLSAPGPIGVIKLDRNVDNVSIKESRDGKVIYVADFTNPDPKTNPLARYVLPPREEGGKPIAKEKMADRAFYERRWEAIANAYYQLVKEDSIRSILIDTGSQLYEECRLSRFGKLTGVLPKEYGAIVKELSEMVLAARGNLILAHRLKKQYRGNEWNGRDYEAIGYNNVSYDCAVTLRHDCTLTPDPEDKTKKKARFTTTVVNCSQDSSLMGLELSDEDSNFFVLASMIYPDAPDGTWE